MDNRNKYILALDQGTTSSRALVVNHDCEVISESQKIFRQIFPRPGWVEHDPVEIWAGQSSVAAEAIARAGINGRDVAAIGITNQRETTIIWDRNTSEPVYNAIVWQDRRTSDFCENIKKNKRVIADMIRQKTGLLIDAYFSATKIKWILDNVPGTMERARRGELCFGTVDSWLIWKFTRGKLHATDVTNASRTMLFNIHTLAWDPDLLEYFGIPASMLPEVRECSGIFSDTATTLFSSKIPIAGVAGDQHAALFGQMCVEPGMTKTTYGTGCFVMMNTGGEPHISRNQMLTTIAWSIGGKTTYALEGSVFVGGAAIQWLRDGLKIIDNAAQTKEMAESIEDDEDVFFVPALTGLGAPYWDQYARGTIIGITRGTTAAHFARAALEAIAFQVYDVVKAMESDIKTRATEMRADGGAVANDFLMQFQADLNRSRVIRPSILETTAMGAAYMAGLAVGFWRDTDDVYKHVKVNRIFEPRDNAEAMARKADRWHQAVERSRGWAKEE